MENKYLTVFNELRNQLLNYPRNTLWNRYLEIIVEEQLKQFRYSDERFEPEKLSRQQIYAKAKNADEKRVDSQLAKNAVKISKLELTLAAFVENQPDCKRAFINLGYKPIIVSSASGGGSKNKTLIWMDIEAIDSADEGNEQTDGSTVLDSDDEDPDDLSSITYERKATSEIKPSLFTRLFFKNGELKMMSFKGILLMLVLLLSFFLDVLIAIYSLFIIMLMNDIPNLKLWQAFVFAILIPVAYLNWRYFFMPLYALPFERVVKAPMFFTNINVDNADIEMYRNKDKLNIARITEFTATCPICSGVIELANGKPDQKPPLVGRCKEAPHAHVYSFDRMTMKGYFLGVADYLADNTLNS